MSRPRQFCTFFLGDLYLGIEVLEVQEVLREQPMTRVPLAPATLHGLINLRGQIVPAVDLRTRLGLAPRPADQAPMNVVVRTDDGAASLLVDEIGDVVEVLEEAFERPPQTLDPDSRETIRGVYKLPDLLLLVLDLDRVLALETAAV